QQLLAHHGGYDRQGECGVAQGRRGRGGGAGALRTRNAEVGTRNRMASARGTEVAALFRVPRSAFRLRRFSGAPRIERVPPAGGRTVTVPPWTTATPRCCSPASRWPAPACAMRSLQHPP